MPYRARLWFQVLLAYALYLYVQLMDSAKPNIIILFINPEARNIKTNFGFNFPCEWFILFSHQNLWHGWKSQESFAKFRVLSWSLFIRLADLNIVCTCISTLRSESLRWKLEWISELFWKCIRVFTCSGVTMICKLVELKVWSLCKSLRMFIKTILHVADA